MNAKCAVPESVSDFFFFGGLSSEVVHFPLLNFWIPVPSLTKSVRFVIFVNVFFFTINKSFGEGGG